MHIRHQLCVAGLEESGWQNCFAMFNSLTSYHPRSGRMVAVFAGNAQNGRTLLSVTILMINSEPCSSFPIRVLCVFR